MSALDPKSKEDQYIEAARAAERVIKEMSDLDPELKKVLFAKILDEELAKISIKGKDVTIVDKPTKSKELSPKILEKDMILHEWCLWVLEDEFTKNNKSLTAEELSKILRDRHRIPTNVISISARLGELTRRGLVMRDRSGKGFKYGITRKGKDYISELKSINKQ